MFSRIIPGISIFLAASIAPIVGQRPDATDPVHIASSQVLHMPGHPELGIIAWNTWDKTSPGFLGQVSVIRFGKVVTHHVLWQSTLDSAYDPKIRFLPEIQSSGLPLTLVQWNYGAAYATMKVIGKVQGRFQLIDELDGTDFEVSHLGNKDTPVIIAHQDPTYFDVPNLWEWNGHRFVRRNWKHPEYYRNIWESDRKEMAGQGLSTIAMLNLGRIAVFAGETREAEQLFRKALAQGTASGAADKETLNTLRSELAKLRLSHGYVKKP